MAKKRTNEQLKRLSDELALKPEKLHPIGIFISETGHLPCPIHGGDNPQGCSVVLDPDSPYFGTYTCWTGNKETGHKCHEVYRNSMIGLVRGKLSYDAGHDVGFNKAFEVCLKLVDLDEDYLRKNATKFKALSEQEKINRIKEKKEERLKQANHRELVRKSLKMPSKYFVGRGYSEKVLDYFDIGISNHPKSTMKGRSIVPVYDDDEPLMVGFLGRWNGDDYDERGVPKWKNNYGFAKSQYLYGFYQNKEDIIRTKTVVLVEGQGDVWRLWEAGIKNAVGLFGTSLSAAQLFTLRTACIVNLVVILDNDPAGIIAREKINTTCSDIFNIINIETSSNDIGDMTIQEINEQIKPNLEGLI